MRDPKKVAAEMSARNEKILEAAFELFSENSIEAVSMNDVANAAGIEIATLYRYYNTKLKLVFAVNAVQWDRFFKDVNKKYPLEVVSEHTAKQRLNDTMDVIIYMYEKERKLLRFDYHMDSFVSHKELSEEDYQAFFGSRKMVTERFQVIKSAAEKDHTVRMDLSNSDFFYSVIYPLISAAAKYAFGVFWAEEKKFDALGSLLNLKEALMNFACTEVPDGK